MLHTRQHLHKRLILPTQAPYKQKGDAKKVIYVLEPIPITHGVSDNLSYHKQQTD
jgi:hypothetical protein